MDSLLRAEQPALACELRTTARGPTLPRYEILVLGDDVIAAFRVVRIALNILRDLADRGLIQKFKVVQGADLLGDSVMSRWAADADTSNGGVRSCRA